MVTLPIRCGSCGRSSERAGGFLSRALIGEPQRPVRHQRHRDARNDSCSQWCRPLAPRIMASKALHGLEGHVMARIPGLRCIAAAVWLALLAAPAAAQPPDTVLLEELTWNELRDAIAAG